MSEFWKQWENQIIDGTFPLRRFLGASSHSAVFLTEHETARTAAAIKLIRGDTPRADLQLARWRAAAALAHPHLIRLLGWGRCRLGSHDLLFVVMEYAEQSLAQILVHRALTFEEVSEMVGPALAALSFIHCGDWVHGQVKPSNICVVDDVLKLASDALRPAGEPSIGQVEFSPYEAPEEAAGSSSSAGDVWGLGMTLVAALTRYPVARRHERSDIVLPTSVTPAFGAAIRQCLSLDPARRPTAKDLETQFAPADPARSNSEPPEQAQAMQFGPRRSRTIILTSILGGIAVLAAALGFGVTHMHARTGPAQHAPAAPISGAASAVVASAAGTERANSQVAAQSPSPPASAAAAAARASTAPVLHEDIPRVPRSALGTIHGRIKVVVRIAVNDAGNVTNSTLQYPGSSRYFARIASESAKAWRFAPAPVRQPKTWLLQFDFTRAGVEASAAPMR